MKLCCRTLGVAFLLVFVFVFPSYPQVNTADITGRVTDQQGLVVPGAIVTATNKRTGRARTATTNDGGDYTITQLPPGRYDLTVEAKSFNKVLAQDFELNVGSKATQNFELKPGEITATVQVTSEAAVVDTTTSEIGKSITPTELQTLPLLNRTFANLSIIAPEARPVGTFDPTKTHVGNVAFSGGDGRQVDVNVDGGDNKDNVVGSLLQNFAYEGIQEFQVLEHRWTSESGRSVGGVVNVVSKSGSNELHGSGFFNFRNQSLRTKDFFEKQTTDEKPSYNREEYGGSVGGPIAKDKMFFFAGFDIFRHTAGSLLNVRHPTSAERGGDLSDLLERLDARGAAAPVRLNDPLSGQLFPNNMIPASRISPVAAELFKLIPAAPVPSGRLTDFNETRPLKRTGQNHVCCRSSLERIPGCSPSWLES